MLTDNHSLTHANADDMVPVRSPLLVPVIANEAGTSGVVESIAEQLLGKVTRHYAVTVATATSPPQIEASLETWLHQARQIAFVSFGLTATMALEALRDSIHTGLKRVAGEDVRPRTLPLPSAMPDRPVFSPLGGIACPQWQLDPLVRRFPGWQGTYLSLEAGNSQLILTCGQPGQVGETHTISASSIIRLLNAALCEQEGPLKRDGDILASYLQSLVGAVLRQAFKSESTISAVPSSFLLPPWLAGVRD